MKKILILLSSVLLLVSCNPSGLAVKKAVKEQMTSYPASTLQDIYKNFYQDAFGPGHMITDEVEAMEDYETEAMTCWATPYGDVLYERTGAQGNYYRVALFSSNIGLVPAEDLVLAFANSAKEVTQKDMDRFRRLWPKIAKAAAEYDIPGYEKDLEDLNNLLASPSMDKAVHHSEAYNNAYHPHYRIVEKSIFKEYLLPYFEEAIQSL